MSDIFGFGPEDFEPAKPEGPSAEVASGASEHIKFFEEASEAITVSRLAMRLRQARELLFHRMQKSKWMLTLKNIAASPRDEARIKREISSNLEALNNVLQSGPLSFAAIDTDAERFYIGRTDISDSDGNPFIIDWRAPVAEAFYGATNSDPKGLRGRWTFRFHGHDPVDVVKESFDSGSNIGGDGLPDPLLRDLARSRTGAMRDIIATIQSEQDAAIRDSRDNCLIIQGGPGTGKTAIGLHRAAFLLYENRTYFENFGLLIVGPNPLFMTYISKVLPSLGETSTTNLTLEGLLGSPELSKSQGDDLSFLGNAETSNIVNQALRLSLSRNLRTFGLSDLGPRASISEESIYELVSIAFNTSSNWRAGKKEFEHLFMKAIEALALGEGLGRKSGVALSSRAIKEIKQEVSRIWPPLTPNKVVEKLFLDEKFLANCTENWLSDMQRELILKHGKKHGGNDPANYWASLLRDEISFQIGDTPNTFGHIIIDEAQDLSPLEFRAIGRRSIAGSMTLLGDIWQGTREYSLPNWREAAGYLGVGDKNRTLVLNKGYRVPQEIMTVANAILAHHNPEAPLTKSVRRGDFDLPLLLEPTAGDGTREIARLLQNELSEFSSIAIICPTERIDFVRGKLEGYISNWRESEDAQFISGSILLSAENSKGLEFDAVIILDPELILESPKGPSKLYVATTRAVQQLAVVTSNFDSLITSGWRREFFRPATDSN